MANIFTRVANGANKLAHAWNAFQEEDDNQNDRTYNQYGPSYSIRPDRRRLSVSNDKSIISSIYTRLGIDSAAVDIHHVRLDDNGRYLENIQSGLESCLTLEANIDQAARAFRQDAVMTMFEKGVVALVPVDTSLNPNVTGSYDINTLRAGEITEWMPRHVKVKLWNDVKGIFQEVTVPKSITAIVENPLYAVMNEPNGTLQRLLRKLSILDVVDDASASGKLDLIIQLPYVIRSDARRTEANNRAKDIEMQLKGSKYGIAYTDGTEKITQLNRPAENNLLAQVQYLTQMLYGQLGLTEGVFNGSASEAEMLNYYNRTIDPVLQTLVEAMRRTFLTKTARSQNQSIIYFRDAFKLVEVKDLAEIADKFARNEILTSNEIRGVMGFKPSDDPKADQLVNSNMPQPGDPSSQGALPPGKQTIEDTSDTIQQSALTHGRTFITKSLTALERTRDTAYFDGEAK